MFEQIGKNLADIFQNREKEYEAEKGRNIATKEDIEEITEKIEQVKRNPIKFPERYVFQLTAEEVDLLKSQNATSKCKRPIQRIAI